MANCAIVGINWGDEGKGRMVDLLTEDYDVVVRFQGGGNAGHTVINQYGKHALHLLPSGIFRKGVVNILGNGVALDPQNLWEEMQEVMSKGVALTPENLKISDRVSLLLPWHRDLDELEEARLADTIARSMSTVWAKAEAKQIELSAECDPAITAQHDPKWTAEALGNILDNAVKYTPSGGSVTVTVRPWQFYTRVDIHDTGIGIPEEHYNDVFQRFYRAQEVAGQEGVGLGLYLANGIITRQKGYISVKSKVGVGTTFSVYLLS